MRIDIITTDYDYQTVSDLIKEYHDDEPFGEIARLVQNNNINIFKNYEYTIGNNAPKILIIEDEINNSLEYITIFSKYSKISSFLVCTKTKAVEAILNLKLNYYPRVIIFDFDLRDKGIIDIPKNALNLYERIKNRKEWNESVILGFTAYEGTNEYSELEQRMRSFGDSVYGKSNFLREGKENVFRDKLTIANLKEEVSVIKEKNKSLLNERSHLNILNIYFKNIISPTEIDKIKNIEKPKYFINRFVGNSFAFKCLQYLIYKAYLNRNLTVNIYGESGTGKESAARAIHFERFKSFKHFVSINCSAIAGNLIESEIFGHEKGAFTGAEREHKGVFERADGGTVFLDEIHHMPKDVQIKLLRTIQEKEFRKVGGEKDIKFNARLITGTNVDLEKEVSQGKMPPDFYYRMKGFQIIVPPLRSRGKEDVILLANYFVRNYFEQNENITRKKKLSDDALNKLSTHDWRNNNIRELRKVVENGIANSVMSESQYIEATDIVIEPTRALSEIDESISSSNKILDNLNFTKKQLRNVILEFDQCLSAINNLEGKTIIEKDGSQYIIEYGDITINHIADQRKISRPAITGKFKKGSNNWYKAKYLMSNSDFVLKYRKVIEKISPLRTLYYDLIESSEGSHKML